MVGQACVDITNKELAARRHVERRRLRVGLSIYQPVPRREVPHVEGGGTDAVVQGRVDLAEDEERLVGVGGVGAVVGLARCRRPDDERAVHAHRHLVLRVRQQAGLVEVSAGCRGQEHVDFVAARRRSREIGQHCLAGECEGARLGEHVVERHYHRLPLVHDQRRAGHLRHAARGVGIPEHGHDDAARQRQRAGCRPQLAGASGGIDGRAGVKRERSGRRNVCHPARGRREGGGRLVRGSDDGQPDEQQQSAYPQRNSCLLAHGSSPFILLSCRRYGHMLGNGGSTRRNVPGPVMTTPQDVSWCSAWL